MKKIIIIVTIMQLGCFLSASGQDKKYKSYTDKIFDKSQYIFEGKVIGHIFFADTINKKMDIYTSNIVQINKIFRGNHKINHGTINIITKGGYPPLQIEKYPTPIQSGYFAYGYNYLFFAVPSDLPTKSKSGESSNFITYKYIGEEYIQLNDTIPYTDNSIRVQIMANIVFYSMSGMGKNFQSKQEIYDFLARHENITIPPEPEKKKEEEKPQFTQAQLDSIHHADSTIKEENRKLYEQRKKNHDQYMEYIQQKIKIAEENQKKKNAEGKKEDEE